MLNLKLLKNNLLFDIKATTPLMEQYFEMKAKHPDAILLYRVGDFYETFSEDAIKVSDVLGITLTSRNNGGSNIELAGFPFHSLDVYLPKLVRAGFRVAICEQLEKPVKGKKVVKRGITDVITPGVTVDNKLLDHKKNNFLAAVSINESNIAGLSMADISTGEFYITEGSLDYINKVIESFNPSEILLPRSLKNSISDVIQGKFYFYYLEDWIFTESYAYKKLLNHFDVLSLKGFGIEEMKAGQIAAGSILNYLESTETHNPKHLSSISKLMDCDYLWMDKFTIRNLELVQSLHSGGISLLNILDQTKTPMGSRLLYKWLIMPLLNIEKIHRRQNAIGTLLQCSLIRFSLEEELKSFGDMERLVSKIPLLKINPRELKSLEFSLQKIKNIKITLSDVNDTLFSEFASLLNPCDSLYEKIHQSIEDDAPNAVSKGGIFKKGVSNELDELKYILTHSKELLLEIQKEEAINTGINNLKIGYNSVFGYFLEVTNKYKNQNIIPEHWVRKQTMSTGERYVTDKLKQLEIKILGAEEKIQFIEEELFKKFITDAQNYLVPLQQNAKIIAEIDSLASLTKVAIEMNYCKPTINDSLQINICNGKHPVIEKLLNTGEDYIPNDIFLDSESQQLIMITGPNMSGKSAILRQTAIICIMAQIGSFVPAESAEIGVIDKVFTRVGASDNISSGESTFMVEMNETASILNNLSTRSLILLDEIGRGTSTYDGISIAWSIAEYLHQSKNRPKTLFATHYHELNELSKVNSRIKNYHVATKEFDKHVVFLRKLVPGGSEHSFGIHVAKMAGMPLEIISSAEDKLKSLESQRQSIDPKVLSQSSVTTAKTDSKKDKIVDEILNIDTQILSPIEALLKIHDLQNKLRKTD